MRHTDIRDLTRAVPFQPFRLTLSNGETYDVWHPDMVMVTLGTAHIARPTPGLAPEEGGGATIVSLVHVLKAEYLPRPSAPVGANGPADPPPSGPS